jgi:putative transposase
VWHTRPLNTATPVCSDKNDRFPAEIVNPAVELSFHFCLSSRAVEEFLCARGITVTDEAIRKWCRQFGPLSVDTNT